MKKIILNIQLSTSKLKSMEKNVFENKLILEKKINKTLTIKVVNIINEGTYKLYYYKNKLIRIQCIMKVYDTLINIINMTINNNNYKMFNNKLYTV